MTDRTDRPSYFCHAHLWWMRGAESDQHQHKGKAICPACHAAIKRYKARTEIASDTLGRKRTRLYSHRDIDQIVLRLERGTE